MSDLINRQDVIEKAHLPTIEDAGYEVIRLDYILSLPSAERTGKWVLWGGMDIPENHGRHKCSECREFALRWYDKPIMREHLSDFCPHCGVKMKKCVE